MKKEEDIYIKMLRFGKANLDKGIRPLDLVEHLQKNGQTLQLTMPLCIIIGRKYFLHLAKKMFRTQIHLYISICARENIWHCWNMIRL